MKKTLREAFQLGQKYWQQADSESYSENRRSDATFAKFTKLCEETPGTSTLRRFDIEDGVYEHAYGNYVLFADVVKILGE